MNSRKHTETTRKGHGNLRVLLCLVMLIFQLATSTATAQSPVITRATSVAIGHIRQQDTYLSPLDYSGTQLSYLKESQRAVTLFGRTLERQAFFQLDLTTTESPAHNADYLGGLLHFDEAWYYCLLPKTMRELQDSKAMKIIKSFTDLSEPNMLSLSIGPQLGGSLGTLYNTRNGNNPAQLIAEVHLAVSAQAAYPFHLWQRRFTIRDQVDVPLIGAMFSPNYGQSYYELFSLGHTDHNVCLTQPFNAPSLRNQLTLDFRLWKQTFRVGYLLDIRQSHVNDLRRHNINHAFLIGWVRHFQRL